MALPARQISEIEGLLGPYCEHSSPKHLRLRRSVRYRIDGHTVTLVERRSANGRGAPWHELPVARFRWTATRGDWTLYWNDRDERWRRYEKRATARRLVTLLREVDRDPLGFFWVDS